MALPTYVGAGTGAGGTGNITPTNPAQTADDILLLFVETPNNAVTAPTGGSGPGWQAVTNSPQGTGTADGVNATRLSVFWLRSNGSEADPTILDTGDHQYGIVHSFRGCHAVGNPWNITAGDVDATSNTVVAIPGATTTVADCLIVLACAWMTDTTANQVATYINVDLANITERSDLGTASGNGGGVAVITAEKATAGAYGATAATAATATRQGRMSIALMPPQGSTGSITGTSTATGVGASTAAASGAVAGTSTVTGVGASIAGGAGSSTGTSTATGVGRSTAGAGGAIAGVGTDTAAGAATAGVAGSIAGTGSDVGQGASTAGGAGAIAGLGTDAGQGGSIAAGVGFGAGSGSVAGATGSASSGVCTATGVGTLIAAGTAVAGATATFAGSGTLIAASPPVAGFETEVIYLYAVDTGVTVTAVDAVEVET